MNIFASEKMRRFILMALGLSVLVGLVLFADPVRVGRTIATADLRWLGVAAALTIVTTLVGAINSFVITGAASFWKYLQGYWAAWAIGLIVPGQVGDVIALSAFLRRHGFALQSSLGRVGTDKLVSLLCSLAVASQLFRLSDRAWLMSVSLIAAAAVCVLLILLILATSIAVRIGTNTRFRLLNLLLGALVESRLVLVTRPGVIVLNIVLSVLKIFITGAAYLAVLYALGEFNGHLSEVTIASISSGIVAYVPITANGIGLVEATGADLFGLLGVPFATTISMYLILRFVNLAIAWAPVAVQLMLQAQRARAAAEQDQ